MRRARADRPRSAAMGAAGETPVLSPRSALRRYAMISFLTWFPPGLTMATIILLMTSRGLGLAEVGVVFAVYSVAIVVLELPTGGFADVVGRRAALAASALTSAVALSLMAVATSFWPFVVCSVLKGVARALSSGPAEAWYVDTLHASEGLEVDLRPGLARGSAMGSVSLCLGTLAGGLLPLVVPGGLAVPMAAAAVAAAVLFVVVLTCMAEPPRPRPSIGSVLLDVRVTIGSGLGLALRHPGLRRLLFAAFAIGVGLNAIELLTPGRLAALTGGAESGSSVYALVAAAGFGASGLGAWSAPRVARRLRGPVTAAVAGTAAAAAAFAALAASVVLSGMPGVVAAFFSYVVMFAAISVSQVLRAEMMHHRVGPSRRATVMSVDSLQLSFGGGVCSLGLGMLAARSGAGVAWWVAAGVLLLSGLLYVRLPVAGGVPRVEQDSVISAQS